MESCGTCRDFFRLTISSAPLRGFEVSFPRGCSRDERQSVKESAQNCQLCHKIYHFLKPRHESTFDLPESDNHPFEITVFLQKSCLHGEKNHFSNVAFFYYIRNRYSIDYGSRYSLAFSIWADEGSSGPDSSTGPITTKTPALMSFVTRPPILRRSPAEANGLVRKFLHNCLDHHESCRLGQPEEEFELPSRVLSIKDEAGGISVKLVENDGLSGRYCALSHCWGPEDKRPLRTLHGNITDHLASIPWNKLPATFQDAITLTIGLGIEYLWIDSLCIVQDDKKDWFHESKKMASVYRRATLVIAAVSSEDSTQGLSKPERPEPLTFSVPFYTQEGSPQSGYNIAEFQNPWGGIDGPLRERAWAFQEWYLGRRKVFFTSEGINWKCDEIECNERGSDTDLRLYETDSWANCLQEYTNKLLTVPSDRLVALLGISAEMQKSRTDSFVPEFGVWEDNLSEQLLWRPTDMMHENLPGLPSWCWAATGGAKAWLVDEQDRIVPNEVMVKSTVNTISLRKSGSVNASGLLTRSTIAPLPLRKCCFRQFEHNTGSYDKTGTIDHRILPEFNNEHYNMRRFPILNPNGASKILGLAVFDRCIYFSECFWFILCSTKRLVWRDPCHPDFGNNPSSSEEDWSTDTKDSGSAFEESGVGYYGGSDDDSFIEESEDSYPGHTHRNTDACVDLYKVGRSKEVHWALLLQPVDNTLKKFTRVGVALLWPRALETGEGEVTEFEIV